MTPRSDQQPPNSGQPADASATGPHDDHYHGPADYDYGLRDKGHAAAPTAGTQGPLEANQEVPASTQTPIPTTHAPTAHGNADSADSVWSAGQQHTGADDAQWRAEQARALGEDASAWSSEQAKALGNDFNAWRKTRGNPTVAPLDATNEPAAPSDTP